MKILLFYHSLVSDWNHGNAHFLRGVTAELLSLGHDVQVYEPEEGWSYTNLMKERGEQSMHEFSEAYPHLSTNFYNKSTDLNTLLQGADLVIVHEWNDPALVEEIGKRKKHHDFKLLFHDTHHRSVTAPQEMIKYDLTAYDGVLAFGEVIKDLYLKNRWIRQAWVWHEAADTRIFKPMESSRKEGDVVWIGNWGDNERTEELMEFLIEPVRSLGLKAKMYGVRYPDTALKLLEKAGIAYGGYLPSYRVPEVLSKYKLTVHVPRRPYTRALPGIPTIRPFEAMACGIPLISAPWEDSEHLFRKGTDHLMVKDGTAMSRAMQELMQQPEKAKSLIAEGLKTITSRHTCAHRVDELLNIYKSLVNEDHLVTRKPLTDIK